MFPVPLLCLVVLFLILILLQLQQQQQLGLQLPLFSSHFCCDDPLWFSQFFFLIIEIIKQDMERVKYVDGKDLF